MHSIRKRIPNTDSKDALKTWKQNGENARNTANTANTITNDIEEINKMRWIIQLLKLKIF